MFLLSCKKIKKKNTPTCSEKKKLTRDFYSQEEEENWRKVCDVLFFELFKTGDAFTAHKQELEFRIQMVSFLLAQF